MSKLVRCEGIVLRSRSFRESSKITTVLSRRSGKIELLARGARKPGSRFGAALEPGTEAEFIYYERENRNLWTLSSADILHPNHLLRENPRTLTVLARILKLLSWLSQPGEVNIGVYNLTLVILNQLRQTNKQNIYYEVFLWRATSLAGYPPHLDEHRGCVVCGKPQATNFSVSQGGFLCSEHSTGEVFRLNTVEVNALIDLTSLPVGEIISELPPILAKLVRYYARYHLHADEKIIP